MSYSCHLYLRTDEDRVVTLMERLQKMGADHFARLMFPSELTAAQVFAGWVASEPEWVVAPPLVPPVDGAVPQVTLVTDFVSSEVPQWGVLASHLDELGVTFAELGVDDRVVLPNDVDDPSNWADEVWQQHRWSEAGRHSLVALAAFSSDRPDGPVLLLEETRSSGEGVTVRRFWAVDYDIEVPFVVAAACALTYADIWREDSAAVIEGMLRADSDHTDHDMLDALLWSPDRRTALHAMLYPSTSLTAHFDAVVGGLRLIDGDERLYRAFDDWVEERHTPADGYGIASEDFVRVLEQQTPEQRNEWFDAFAQHFPGSAEVLEGLPTDLWVMTAQAVVEADDLRRSGFVCVFPTAPR